MRPLVIAWLCLTVLAGCTALAGCQAHVTLPPPVDASAPLEVREHLYHEYAIGKPAREDLAIRTRLLADRPTVTRRAATLGGGVRVTAVEDLRPLVDAHSATATSLDAAVALRSRADLLLGGGLALGSAGTLAAITLMALDLGVVPDTGSKAVQGGVSPLLIAAAASFVVGVGSGGALATWGMTVLDDADDATHRAFGSYDADLRARLALPAPPP